MARFSSGKLEAEEHEILNDVSIGNCPHFILDSQKSKIIRFLVPHVLDPHRMQMQLAAAP